MKTMAFSTLIGALAAVSIATAAWAGEVDVTDVKVRKTGDNTYRFDVTLLHADTGWDHYANVWEVVAPDGTVLGTRVLAHPHVDEQPFTRSLSGVRIPADNDRVFVEASTNVGGWGIERYAVQLEP